MSAETIAETEFTETLRGRVAGGRIVVDCQRRGCGRDAVEHVRFEGDSTARTLCRPCSKDYRGTSS